MNRVNIPIEMIEEAFAQYAGRPQKRPDGTWIGACPICHEGNSWSTKRRLTYRPYGGRDGNGTLYCYNCSRLWNPLSWILEVSGESFSTVMKTSKSFDYCSVDLEPESVGFHNEQVVQSVLPENPILLTDPIQVKYFSDHKSVIEAVSTIRRRRLDTAVNKCPYYLSITDFIHRNRLCIPFIGVSGEIGFYQTRKLFSLENKKIPKYLSKSGAEKTIFGINNVSIDIPYLFVTEGPIDSCFIRNGVSMAGLVMTVAQRRELQQFIGMELVWILDNDIDNPDVLKQYKDLIVSGERVFIWPKMFKGYKDVNEICVDKGIDEIPTTFFETHSYRGREAAYKLKEVLNDYV